MWNITTAAITPFRTLYIETEFQLPEKLIFRGEKGRDRGGKCTDLMFYQEEKSVERGFAEHQKVSSAVNLARHRAVQIGRFKILKFKHRFCFPKL